MSYPGFTAIYSGFGLWLTPLVLRKSFPALLARKRTCSRPFEATTGGRVIFSVCKVGGVHRDIKPEMLQKIAATVEGMKRETKELCDVF